MQCACAVLPSVVYRIYNVFSHYLLNCTILKKKSYWTQNVCDMCLETSGAFLTPANFLTDTGQGYLFGLLCIPRLSISYLPDVNRSFKWYSRYFFSPYNPINPPVTNSNFLTIKINFVRDRSLGSRRLSWSSGHGHLWSTGLKEISPPFHYLDLLFLLY